MVLAAFVFVLGICIGSFTNVLIYRLPESVSILRPASRCRSCGRPLGWAENVPLVSYLAQRGRCRGCGARISLQYPAVELAVGLLFLGNFLLYGGAEAAQTSSWPQALASPRWIVGAVFTTLLLAIAVTDLRTYLIPNELSLGGALLGLALSPLAGGVTPLESFLGAVLGAGLLLGGAWVGRILFGREAMGMGDVKMMAMVGAFVGWEGVFLTVFLGALLGTLVYGPFVIVRRLRAARPAAAPSREGAAAGPDRNGAHAAAHAGAATRRAANAADAVEDETEEQAVDRELVPFGFFLAPAAGLAYYWGEELVRGYLRLTGLSG
jgi:leader peptidase (prepilin peptidase)/N-methyltransferase